MCSGGWTETTNEKGRGSIEPRPLSQCRGVLGNLLRGCTVDGGVSGATRAAIGVDVGASCADNQLFVTVTTVQVVATG